MQYFNRVTGHLIIVLMAVQTLSYAGSSGDIDPGTLREIRTSLTVEGTNRALMNAITNNDIHKLVLNRELVNNHEDIFNLKIDVKGITDQKSTGRCWMFAGLNIMRPAIIKKYNLSEFEFSQNYLFFWDKLEKFNFFLESIIETRESPIDDRKLRQLLDGPVADGGWWNYVASLIDKYGVVPKEIMPETVNSEKSKLMNKTLEYLALQYAAELRNSWKSDKNLEKLQDRKNQMLKSIYKILVMHLGLPPESFRWRYEDKDKTIHEKNYTPVQFYQEVVGVQLWEYITLFNYPGRPFNQYYQVDFRRNMFDKPDMDFVNLEIDQLKQYTLVALLDNEPVWFAADAGWHMERELGIMADGIYDYESLFGITADMSKADRIMYGASAATHAMTFIGADTLGGKSLKWRVENSWGTDLGDKGYWTMYDNWFDKYVFTLIIHRKYLPEKVLALLKTKPTLLPTWDPLAKSLDEMGR
jgi:bleomycin hydrolase